MAKTLGESLNTARANLSGTIITIEGKDARVVPYILFGLLCVVFGVTVYIVLPMALLAENASVILQIFFAIIVGLILGLTLLAANLRGFLEKIVVYLFFLCERKSMRAILKKNLVAHTQTNKMTSIIYALTLGCVINLSVSLNLILRTVSLQGAAPNSDISVFYSHRDNGPLMFASDIDPILREYASSIKEFSFVTSIERLYDYYIPYGLWIPTWHHADVTRQYDHQGYSYGI